MRAYILVALLVILAVVVNGEDVEERGFLRLRRCRSDRHCRGGVCCKGWCMKKCPKRCKSDRDCEKGECCRGLCSAKCIKRCKSEDDCKEGQCCLKYRYYSIGICRDYKQEGDKCCKKSNGLFHFMRRDCGCAEGLQCQTKKGAFFFGYLHGYRYGKCVSEEGSGDM